MSLPPRSGPATLSVFPQYSKPPPPAQAPTPAPQTHVGHLADSVKATGMSIARFSSTLVVSRCGGCRGRSTADVAARGGAGGVGATRSLQRRSEVGRPDGAEAPRRSAV